MVNPAQVRVRQQDEVLRYEMRSLEWRFLFLRSFRFSSLRARSTPSPLGGQQGQANLNIESN